MENCFLGVTVANGTAEVVRRSVLRSVKNFILGGRFLYASSSPYAIKSISLTIPLLLIFARMCFFEYMVRGKE